MFPFRHDRGDFYTPRRDGAPSVKMDIRPSRADPAPQPVELPLEWNGGHATVWIPRAEDDRPVVYDICRSRE